MKRDFYIRLQGYFIELYSRNVVVSTEGNGTGKLQEFTLHLVSIFLCMLVHYSPSSPIFFPLPFSMVADGCPTAPNFTCSRHGESCFLLISESRIWFAQLGAGGYSWIISHNWVGWERTGSPNVKLATGGPAPRIRRRQVQMKKENNDLNRHSKMFLLYSNPLLLNISVYFMLPLEIHGIHEKPWSQGSYWILLNSVFSAFTGSWNSFGNMAIKTPWNIV